MVNGNGRGRRCGGGCGRGGRRQGRWCRASGGTSGTSTVEEQVPTEGEVPVTVVDVDLSAAVGGLACCTVLVLPFVKPDVGEGVLLPTARAGK